MFSSEGVAHFGGDGGVSERLLPLVGWVLAVRPAAVLASARYAPVSSLRTSLLPLASSRGPARFARPASLRERSEALRYGARLVVREAHHERADSEARKDVEERLNQNVYLNLDITILPSIHRRPGCQTRRGAYPTD